MRGISWDVPHFRIWCYFFSPKLLLKRPTSDAPARSSQIGCVAIHLWGTRPKGYIPLRLCSSNKGWHNQWFYLHNTGLCPPPAMAFLLCDALGGLQSWAWGVRKEGQKKTVKATTAVAILHDCRVTLAGIIDNYFHRGVAPLMATRLALFKMTIEAPSDGSRLSALPPSDAEIAH